MKCVRNTVNILKDESGETIAEVLIAFILLTIVLLIYSQGIAMATKSEFNADNSRTGADQAMKQVQDDITDYKGDDIVDCEDLTEQYQVPGYLDTRIVHNSYTVTVDGKTYTYVYYEPILG